MCPIGFTTALTEECQYLALTPFVPLCLRRIASTSWRELSETAGNMKTRIPPVLFTFALICFALLPHAQAVVPAPDGGYPGFTTAEGTKALQSLTTGSANTAVGWFSLFSNAGGSFNTAAGGGTLLFNTGDQNTAFGAAALLFNTTGINNTAVGVDALLNNTIAEENTATGAFALNNNTEGDFNTATGAFALWVNTIGERNTATGDSAMFSNTTGNRNTATGNAALGQNTTGHDNTAMGSGALAANSVANSNTATGVGALANSNTDNNTATGFNALFNATGPSNTAYGFSALSNNTTGGFNTASGFSALLNNTTGSANIALGDSAGLNVTTASDVICIGAGVQGENVDNSCYIGNIFGSTSSNGVAVLVNSNGRLGTMTSSARFKDEIKPMNNASEALFSLNPVTFRYKKGVDPQGIRQFGLVAEEVEKVNPDLIVRDKEGKPYSVRYDQVNAMLLNEFLKEHKAFTEEHRTVQEQQATITQLKKDFGATIAHLTARLDDQATQIQKVSAQLEASKPAPQVVNNP
jgi:hypothetical protein